MILRKVRSAMDKAYNKALANPATEKQANDIADDLSYQMHEFDPYNRTPERDIADLRFATSLIKQLNKRAKR